MTPAIRTQDLSKTYRVGFLMRRVEGLKKLDLEVSAGQVFGFIGPNGAGKTTTIKILMGLHNPTEGAAWMMGRPVSHRTARERVGFLPERPYFYTHLTGREVLHFYGQLYGMTTTARTARIRTLLEKLDMARHADIKLGKYSKGMLQRIGLCQALLNDPDLIVLDEPMSGLDPLGRALVRDLILDQRNRGKTVFFSSHILSDVEAICDTVGILVAGELRGVGTVESLIDNRVRAVEIEYSGVSEPPVGAVPIRSTGGTHRVRVQPQTADADVEAIRNAGGRILEIQRVRADLEAVLVDEMNRPEEGE
jgi:ABC-2 type transport system ATP-binding protein